MPTITLIAAMANNRVIGKDNAMPWHMPADLKHFKATTLGKPIVMGRKTFESIGRALPGRRNIVVSRNPAYEAEGCDVMGSLDEAITALNHADEIIIMGGATLYEQAMPMADKLELTFIDLDTEGDAFFPEWNADEWDMTNLDEHCKDDNNPYDYRFMTMVRKSQL